jgi:predicted NAD/FAD-binding protein
MKIAIIGSGISGLSCAYHLDAHKHQTTIFEKANYFGGHTDTHQFEINGEKINVDSGFIVFAREYYPHFSAMLDELGISSKPTEMSFSASNPISGLVYNATNLNKLFCQRKNLINPKFYRMIIDIVRFYKTAPKILLNSDSDVSAGEYFTQKKYSATFQEDHIFPMIGALWSTPPALVSHYPIRFLVEYMSAHGMMDLWNRPDWQVLKNGSFEYINALKNKLNNTTWKLHCGVTNVIREEDRVLIHSASAEPEYFDAVVFACHANQAKIILQKPSADETEILGNISFEPNEVTIHTDETIMPNNPLAWASWNTSVSTKPDEACSATYWMNELQGLKVKTNIFVSLNENRTVNPEKILKKRQYHHPSYTMASVTARQQLSTINGKNRSAFAGAYWGWAFHEDGARSGYEAAKILMKNYA